MIYFTSDLHFGHNKEFIFKPRGFDNIEDMNIAVFNNCINAVSDDDDFYILGDLMLGSSIKGIELIKQLKGKIHIILGNHDTNVRIELYKSLPNVVEIAYSTVIRYGRYHFYLSHYPAMVENNDKFISEGFINLFGHTHSSDMFYDLSPRMYNVALDAHNNLPVSIEQIIIDCRKRYVQCKDKNKLNKALEICMEAHSGQLDKGGNPYVFHPIFVASQMNTDKQKIIALLHDVIEDSNYTDTELSKYFTDDIIKSVKILTRSKDTDYFEYVHAIKYDKDAKLVKMSDLKHNMDLSRIPKPSAKDINRVTKYQKALDILEGGSNVTT